MPQATTSSVAGTTAGDEVAFHRYSVGTRTARGPIVECPKCGRPGQLRPTDSGTVDLVVHTMKRRMIWQATDICRIPKTPATEA